MKTTKFKSALSILVLILAIFSSFAFKSSEPQALLGFENGWINLPGQPCAVQVPCDNVPSNNYCTAIYNGAINQAFGKTVPSLPYCNKILYRLQ